MSDTDWIMELAASDDGLAAVDVRDTAFRSLVLSALRFIDAGVELRPSDVLALEPVSLTAWIVAKKFAESHKAKEDFDRALDPLSVLAGQSTLAHGPLRVQALSAARIMARRQRDG